MTESTYSITEDVVSALGRPEYANTLYQNTTVKYDTAIGGQPFFLAASDKFPYHRETATYKKQQVDLTQSPGEQSFEGWWLRSQSSFHLGAGIKYLEPLQGDNVMYRFDSSKGVDVWTPGKASLLNSASNVKALSSNIDMFGCIDGSNNSCVFVSDDDTLTRITELGSVYPVGGVNYGGSGSNISSITQDGTNYYAANATGIYKGLLTGSGTGTKIWNTGTTKVKIAWVKQRLFAGIDNSLYELVSGGPSLPTATYTHPNSNWKWTSIVEGPNAIYASGYAGTASAIYKISLDADGTLPTLTRAVTAADFPDEEHVTSLGVYLGKYMMIGTNKGVRVGLIDSNGFISYGGLTVESKFNSHVSGFAFNDRFAYATVTNSIDNYSGLVRIDLSAEVENGRYAWATDLCAEAGGACYNVAFIGETGRLAFTVEDEGLFFESSSEVVESGYIRTGAIRYNTLEKKHFKFVKTRIGLPFEGDIAVSTVDKAGNVNSLITIGSATIADNDITTNLPEPVEQLAFQFTLYRNADDTAKGASIVGYQVKALPANRRNRSIAIPLMCFDYEEDRYNVRTGYEGNAWDRIEILENLESQGNTVTIQDFTTGEQVDGVIEKITFDRTSPPERRFSGFGGIVYVQVRTI
jgi:hypothetical protein